MVKQFVISAGHAEKVQGAVGYLKEHQAADKVVNRVHKILTTQYNGKGYKFDDKTSTTQNQNLYTIVKYHNSKERALDISVHFNSAGATASGSECCYYDAKKLADKMSEAMAKAMGIPDRGPKERKELYFLRNTTKPAILLEVCFVTSKKDATEYNKDFEPLCQAIAKVIADELGYKKITATKKTTKKTTKTSATAGKTINQLAKEVIRGKYGNGRERMLALGSKYEAVQKEVSKLLAK